mgnify:FL=1
MKALIVDDVQANCRMLKGLLAPFGVCEVATTGREAVVAFQRAWNAGEPFHLICLDIMLPDLDGLKVLEVIRKMEDAMHVTDDQRIRAVMISAADDFDHQARARTLHCDGYLQKPIFRKDLIAVLKQTHLIEEDAPPTGETVHSHPKKPSTPA